MTREEAIRRIENHIRIHSRQEPFRACLIQEALQMAVDALKAHETSLEQLAEAYGLTVDGVQFALEQYQTVICEITHSRMSKLSYFADDILRLANDLQCEGCELQEPRVMTISDFKDEGVYYLEALPPFVLRPVIYRLDYSDPRHYNFVWKYDQFTWNTDEYGKTWRCWTSRPTDTQREASPWMTSRS